MIALGLVLILAATAAVLVAGSEPSEEIASRDDALAYTPGWKTWVLADPGAVAVPPPRAVASEREARGEASQVRARAWQAYPAVRPWLETAMEYVAARTKDPPAASRAYAYVAVAMHDAVLSAWHWKHVFRRPSPDPDRSQGEGPFSYPSVRAAVAGAASRVLAHLFPEQPRAALEKKARTIVVRAARAGESSLSDSRAGLALGHEVARRVVARARRDGFRREWHGSPPRGRGLWAPPPGSVARPVQPLAGRWRTWVLRSGNEFRPDSPPRFGGRKFTAEAEEVVRVEANLTARQRRIAKFWAGGDGTALPPGIWIEVILKYLKNHDRLAEPEAARVVALTAVALADAGVASWDAKYAYWSPRPENAIRDLGIARGWRPFLNTPFFPAYPSGHATYSAAVSEVLAYLFPEDARSWRTLGREAAMSRIYGGIHYRSDSAAGGRLGRQIGARVIEWASTTGARE